MGKEFGVSVVNKQTNKKLGILETEENFFHMIKGVVFFFFLSKFSDLYTFSEVSLAWLDPDTTSPGLGLSLSLLVLLPQMFAIFLGNDYTYGGKHGLKGVFKGPKANILNGQRPKAFPPRSGIIQGCPLSPLLFTNV